jgi:hypothetical protein
VSIRLLLSLSSTIKSGKEMSQSPREMSRLAKFALVICSGDRRCGFGCRRLQILILELDCRWTWLARQSVRLHRLARGRGCVWFFGCNIFELVVDQHCDLVTSSCRKTASQPVPLPVAWAAPSLRSWCSKGFSKNNTKKFICLHV